MSAMNPLGDAQEALAAILAEMDRFSDKVLSGTASDEEIGGMAPVIIGIWADKLRSALQAQPKPAEGVE